MTVATGTSRKAGVVVRECAASGTGVDVVEIVRRADRGDDLLTLLVHRDGSWWIGRHVAGVTRVVAFIGDAEAERDFELFLASPSPRGEWAEAPVGVRAA